MSAKNLLYNGSVDAQYTKELYVSSLVQVDGSGAGSVLPKVQGGSAVAGAPTVIEFVPYANLNYTALVSYVSSGAVGLSTTKNSLSTISVWGEALPVSWLTLGS